MSGAKSDTPPKCRLFLGPRFPMKRQRIPLKKGVRNRGKNGVFSRFRAISSEKVASQCRTILVYWYIEVNKRASSRSILSSISHPYFYRFSYRFLEPFSDHFLGLISCLFQTPFFIVFLASFLDGFPSSFSVSISDDFLDAFLVSFLSILDPYPFESTLSYCFVA